MEKLKKHLQDIKNTLPIMLKFNSIDQSAFKALNKAVSECLSMLPEEKQNKTSICYYTDSSDLNIKKLKIMPDITMCRNEKCLKKQSCYRFTATPKEFGQWVQVFEPKNNTEEKFECENHFPNNNSK